MTLRAFGLGMVLPLALLLLAEIVFRGSGIRSDSLAAPSDVLAALLRGLVDGSMLGATAQTLGGAAGGFAIGCAGGIALGLLMGLSERSDRLLEMPVEAVRPVPSIALLPIALLVFGFGYRIEFAVVGFSCIFTAAILTRSAIREIEPRLREVSRLLRLGRLATVRKVVLPAALPRIFIVLRLAASIALIVSVTVEITMNPQGLGHEMMSASHALKPDVMLAYLVWLGLIGVMLNLGLLLLQRQLFGRMAAPERTR